MKESTVLERYDSAKEIFRDWGIDTDKAIMKADSLPISMHTWQGDDLIGFDGADSLSGGIATTGNYPGRARTPEELRADIKKVATLCPGKTKVNVQACHAEKNGKIIDRDGYTIEQFRNWVNFAKENNFGLDFNATFFSHPMMDGDFSLASQNEEKRKFWVEHGKRCREIGEEFGKQVGEKCVVNYWMPDGMKDKPADTKIFRDTMLKSLDEIFKTPLDETKVAESIESKLFGLGVESYTVASHEFSLGYAITRNKLYCLDAGHFHPTETISSKFSAVMEYLKGLQLHVSRGVRWDSDHVVTLDDELSNIMDEIILNGYEKKVNIGLDYFDASINRLACWVIGMRNARIAILNSCLRPIEKIREAELCGDFTSRLALQETIKGLPYSDVFSYYCLKSGVPLGKDWLDEVKKYEKDVLALR